MSMNPYEAPQTTEENDRSPPVDTTPWIEVNPRMAAKFFLAVAIPVACALALIGLWIFNSRERIAELQKEKADAQYSKIRGNMERAK